MDLLMTNEMRISLKNLEEAIEFSSPQGEGNHRMVYHLLCMLREAGWNWRKQYSIVLYDEESEPEFDEDYAKYLDNLACGLSAGKWPEDYKENIENTNNINNTELEE